MPIDRSLRGVVTQANTRLYPQYRGEWQPVRYEVADIVRYNNALYVAESNTSSIEIPGASNNWKVVIDDGGLLEDAAEHKAEWNTVQKPAIEQALNQVAQQNQRVQVALADIAQDRQATQTATANAQSALATLSKASASGIVRSSKAALNADINLVAEGGMGTVVSQDADDGNVYMRQNGAWVLVTNTAPPFINLRRFGGVGDGVANEDMALAGAMAFIRAVKNATGTAPGLFIPRGKWKYAQDIILDYDGAVIFGEGTGNTQLLYTGTQDGIKIGKTAATPNTYASNRTTYLYGIRDLRLIDQGGNGKNAINLEYGREGALERLLVDGRNAAGWAEFGVKYAGDATLDAGCWTSRALEVRVQTIGGVGFGFLGANQNAMFLERCSGSNCLYTAWVEAGNGMTIRNLQSEQPRSGYDIRVSPYTLTSTARVLGLQLDGYFEMLKSSATARALYITDMDKSGVRRGLALSGLHFAPDYVWGGKTPTHAVELDVQNGFVFGQIDLAYVHGVSAGGVKASRSTDRVTITGNRILNDFGTGAEVPLLDDGGTSACITLENKPRAFKINQDLTLRSYATDSTYTAPEDGSIHYSSNYGRLRLRALGAYRSIPVILTAATDPDAATLPREPGVSYFNTSSSTLRVWNGAAYVNAVPATANVRVVRNLNAAGAITDTDDIVKMAPTADVTVTLPDADMVLSQTRTVMNMTTAYTITLTPASGDSISGATNTTVAPGQRLTLLARPGGWEILSRATT